MAGHEGASTYLTQFIADPNDPAVEDKVVRRYRFLLRTAPPDALEAATHRGAGWCPGHVPGRSPGGGPRGFVVGWRLTPDDVTPIARILVRGERRHPGGFLSECQGSALRTLADGECRPRPPLDAWVGTPHGMGPNRRGREGPTDSAWGERWHDRLTADPQHTDVDGEARDRRRLRPVVGDAACSRTCGDSAGPGTSSARSEVGCSVSLGQSRDCVVSRAPPPPPASHPLRAPQIRRTFGVGPPRGPHPWIPRRFSTTVISKTKAAISPMRTSHQNMADSFRRWPPDTRRSCLYST